MNSDYTLGLSSIHGRLAVGLVCRGRVAFAVEEDKLRRFRGLGFAHLREIGSRALDSAVSRVPGGIHGIGRVAYVPPDSADEARVEEDVCSIREFFVRHFGAAPPVEPVDHASAHIAFERAVHPNTDHVFMLGRSRAVYSAEPGQPYDLDLPFGLVRGIERLAAFAGFPPARIHHLENMARFGEPRFVEAFGALLQDRAGAPPDVFERALQEVTGLGRRLAGQPLGQAHYDYAASVYRVLESETVRLLASVGEEKRSGALAVCGGVFQSWTLNDALARAFPGSRIQASFAPGNASGAVGGPLLLAGPPAEPVGPYLGPEYSREEIKAVLDNSKVRYSLLPLSDARNRASEALEAGQMVGWFEGRCEFGYRALGSRSVVASPANPYACDNLSSYLKQRPSYFAYAVAIDESDPRVRDIDSPYLSRSALLGEYFRDSPVRIQAVSRGRSPSMWQLLGAFRARTGVPALLNTSLNYFDEPIACTPRDALKTFYASGLDMLVMEGFVLTKH